MTFPRTLAVAGASIGVLLGVFVLLFANVPAGFNAVSGLHLPAVTIFARQWSYPTLALSPREFAALYCATLVTLWAPTSPPPLLPRA